MARPTRSWSFLLLSALSASPLLAQEPPPAPGDNGPDKPAASEVPAAELPVAPPEALEGVEKVPVTLAHRYTTGTRLVYEQRQTMEVEQGPMGTMSMQTGFGIERTVKEGRADGALLIEKFLHVVQEMNGPNGPMTLDTRDQTRSGNPGVDCLEGLVGGSIEIELTGSGEVKKVRGAAALVERIVATCPPEMQDLMAMQLAQNMNDETMARQTQENLVQFPAGELQPGAAWRRTAMYPIPPLDEVERTIDYVYLGVVDRGGVKCAKLWTRTKVGKVDGRQTEIQGTPATISLSAFEGTAPMLVRLSDGETLEYGPLELSYTAAIDVMGQHVDVAYKAMTRLEARSEASAAPTTPEEH